MSRPIHTTLRSCACPLAAALLAAGLCAPLQAQQLLAPNATVASFSQSYMTAALAQWEFSFPAATNPLLDTTGANSGLGDMGKYFFLASSLSSDPVVRSVTVRNDQVLVFSPTAVVFYAVPGDPYQTEAEMRAEAVQALGETSNLLVTVNGAPALLPAGVSSLQEFRQFGPLVPLNVPPGSVLDSFGSPTGTYPSVTLGITYAMEALPVGQHQLRFTSTSTPIGAYAGYAPVSYDITYNITAVPEPGTVAMLCLGLAVVGALSMRKRRMDQTAAA